MVGEGVEKIGGLINMVCTRLSDLLAFEVPHYLKILEERKAYFDELTGYDVWSYLVERDFQKRFFEDWAKEEKVKFCMGCDVNGGCLLKH